MDSLPSQKRPAECFNKNLSLNLLPPIFFHKATLTVIKFLSVSSPLTVKPRWYFFQAILNIGTDLAVFAKHSANLLSTTVSIIIWKAIGDR